jgi:hypothetical protein
VGCILKILLFALSGFFFGAVVIVAIGAFLMVTGSPGTCTDRDIVPPPSTDIAALLDDRWDLFSQTSAAKQTNIQITESEATSRGRQYVDDEDVPIEDLRVYFCGDGKGQLAGKVAAIGLDVDFVVTGHLDTEGPQPVVELDSIDVGNLPGFISDTVFDLLLNDDARTLDLDENLLGSEIQDGLINISGGPSQASRAFGAIAPRARPPPAAASRARRRHRFRPLPG